MKKALAMLELIFVVVILGIIASVAIPRLAGTRTDAEITSTIANIRTFLSDISTYYTTKGSIDKDVWFGEFTNVPLVDENGDDATLNSAVNKIDPWLTSIKSKGFISVGNDNKCIGLSIVPGGKINNRAFPALVKFDISSKTNSSICNAVRNNPNIQQFVNFKVSTYNTDGSLNALAAIPNSIAIGASADIYGSILASEELNVEFGDIEFTGGYGNNVLDGTTDTDNKQSTNNTTTSNNIGNNQANNNTTSSGSTSKPGGLNTNLGFGGGDLISGGGGSGNTITIDNNNTDNNITEFRF